MILPPGMNEAAGLAAALREQDISLQNVVGVGDAENDHSFLRAYDCAAAVANTGAHHLLPASREKIAQIMPEEMPSVIFVMVHPDAVAVEPLKRVQVSCVGRQSQRCYCSILRVLRSRARTRVFI
jgi:hypothetical protein